MAALVIFILIISNLKSPLRSAVIHNHIQFAPVAAAASRANQVTSGMHYGGSQPRRMPMSLLDSTSLKNELNCHTTIHTLITHITSKAEQSDDYLAG